MAISSPYDYTAGQTPDEEQNKTLQASDRQGAPSPQVNANQPYSPPRTETQTSPSPQQSSTSNSQQDQAPPQTFAQMQQAGVARPPMPQPSQSQAGGAAPMAKAGPDLSQPGPQNSLMPLQNNASLNMLLPQQTLGNPNPQQTDTVSTLPGVGVTQQTAPNTTTAQFGASSPLSGMTEQQKAQYWAAKGVTGLAYGATPTGSVGNPNAGGSVSTYGNTSANDAALAAQGQALIPGVQASQAANLAGYDATNQAGDDASNLAGWAQYANSAAGKATGLDPTKMPAWWTGNAPSPSQGGAFGSPVNSPTQTLGGQTTGFTPTDNPSTGGGTPSTTGTTVGGQTLPASTTGTAPNSNGGFDLLNTLTQGAAGQGQGSTLQNATQDAALKYLQNPNPYGSQDVQNQYKYLSGNIDDQYKLQQRALGEEMARRGLGNSTNYGGRLQDLNIGQRNANEVLGTDLAHQYAQNYGQSQQAALGLGNQIGSTGQQNQQSWIQQLMNYGQNAFGNDLATNQQNQNAAQSYQNYILQLLGAGYSPTG